jgi:hypothetical protein
MQCHHESVSARRVACRKVRCVVHLEAEEYPDGTAYNCLEPLVAIL